ncbi:MAG TPA: transglutaminase-like domain-containing protein, partial [Thermoanaerobaculia bacterium]|nr:transglutaminase-like domain-containing protein [Thermoanaerobaculia bacterium]
MSRAAWCISMMLALLAAPNAWGAGRIVEGVDQAFVIPPSGASVEPYSNDGYSIERSGSGFLVQVAVAPLRSKAEFEVPAKPKPGSVGALAWRLVAGSHLESVAVERVLGWVSRNIRYDLDRRQDQTADAVLARRRGYCTGIARLSVALFRSIGIEAREVDGYVLRSSRNDGPGYHRWIEVFYPDKGWVFSDPASTHGFVPATYVRLADRRVTPTWSGEPGRLVWRRDHLAIVDQAPGLAAHVWARALTWERRAGTLDLTIGEQE